MARLNLTRDQFAAFLQDHQQIRQFEILFSTVDELLPDTVRALLIASGNADARAIQALGQIAQTAQDAAATTAVLDAKTTLALGQIATLAQQIALDLAVVEGRATLTHDMLSSILTPLQALALAPSSSFVIPLPVNFGGTGQISFTNGQLLIGNTTGNTLTKATLTAGTNIGITNGTGSISIATVGASGSFTTADTPPQTVTVVDGIITSIV